MYMQLICFSSCMSSLCFFHAGCVIALLILLKMRSWSHLDYLIKLPDMIKNTFVPLV